MSWQTLKNFLSWAPLFTLAIYSGGIYGDVRRHAPIPDTVPMHATLNAGQGITCVIVSDILNTKVNRDAARLLL